MAANRKVQIFDFPRKDSLGRDLRRRLDQVFVEACAPWLEIRRCSSVAAGKPAGAGRGPGAARGERPGWARRDKRGDEGEGEGEGDFGIP